MKTRINNFILALCTLLTLTIAPLFALSGNAAAVNIFSGSCTGADGSSAVCSDVKAQSRSSTNPIVRIIKAAITIVSIIVGLAAVIVLMISGFRMITSSGDPQGVAKARSGVLYALIGIAIAVFAEAIVSFALK